MKKHARPSRDELIKGTDHVHFHEHIRVPNKKKKGKGKNNNNNYDDEGQPEVVKMQTGTLYIFRGQEKRVVFVRNK